MEDKSCFYGGNRHPFLVSKNAMNPSYLCIIIRFFYAIHINKLNILDGLGNLPRLSQWRVWWINWCRFVIFQHPPLSEGISLGGFSDFHWCDTCKPIGGQHSNSWGSRISHNSANLFSIIFAKNCMKMKNRKNIGLRGGTSPAILHILRFFKKIQRTQGFHSFFFHFYSKQNCSNYVAWLVFVLLISRHVGAKWPLNSGGSLTRNNRSNHATWGAMETHEQQPHINTETHEHRPRGATETHEQWPRGVTETHDSNHEEPRKHTSTDPEEARKHTSTDHESSRKHTSTEREASWKHTFSNDSNHEEPRKHTSTDPEEARKHTSTEREASWKHTFIKRRIKKGEHLCHRSIKWGHDDDIVTNMDKIAWHNYQVILYPLDNRIL